MFVEDYISYLKEKVDAGDSDSLEVKKSNRDEYPFLASSGNKYKFAYYDPLYDCKVAYNNGERVEYRLKSSDTEWALTNEPIWDDERYEYRIKPKPKEIAATNREVLEWLAKENGMVKAYQNTCTISFCISEEDMDKPCMHKVCKWEDREWHDATHEYLGI